MSKIINDFFIVMLLISLCAISIQVQIIGLEEFAEQTLTFLKSAIRRRYPYCETSATSMAEEEQGLHQLQKSRRRMLVILL